MDDTWTKTLLALLPVLVGAGIGIVPTLLLERMKSRAALRTRWDQTRQVVCAQFAACVRRIVDIAEEPGNHADELDTEHRQLQIHMAEIRIVGGLGVQATARTLIGTTYLLQQAAGTEEALDARTRTLNALFEFYRAARLELQVPDAEEMVPLNPTPGLP